jgi:nucleoside-diphosphate-sugar epimerase
VKIAVVGASGFVGSTLVERLYAKDDDLVPFIHSTGNAWRLARLGIPLETLDLLDGSAVREALEGCTHVVNCSRGGSDVMIKGLQNLLTACRANRVTRFVHLSSVMVYGDPPSQDSATEDGRTEPQRGTYGWIKLQQDQMVREAALQGLSSLVLCPPNISGAYSPYYAAILGAIRSGEMALVDNGARPCNVVDVCNLAHAIELALAPGPSDGRRLFITDDQPTTWREVLAGLLPMLDGPVAIREISSEELLRLRDAPTKRTPSFRRSLLHLISSDVRHALRKDPLWARVDTAVRRSARILGKEFDAKVRLSLEGPAAIPRRIAGPALDVRLCAQQLRTVTHSCARAKEQLGYQPLYSLDQSMAAFRRCYAELHGWTSPMERLFKAI